jgi:hypothetical protein
LTDQEIIDLLVESIDNGVTDSMFDALGVPKVQLLRLYIAGKIDMRTRKLAKPASTVVTFFPISQ